MKEEIIEYLHECNRRGKVIIDFAISFSDYFILVQESNLNDLNEDEKSIDILTAYGKVRIYPDQFTLSYFSIMGTK